jgi:hypothetical protein
MLKDYYFWKWADNDLPGSPVEVHADLLRGKMHPSIRSFNAVPLLRRLEKARAEGRQVEEEWSWQIYPHDSPSRALFVFVICPEYGGFSGGFGDVFVPLGLACHDEQEGRLAKYFIPKLNCLVWGQYPEDVLYDIRESDLKLALKRLNPKMQGAFAILMDNRNFFVQCFAQGRRFLVEWRENYDFRRPSAFEHWSAQDAKRLAAAGGFHDYSLPENVDPDLIRFEDTLDIFNVFLRGEPLPMRYTWLNITNKLKLRRSARPRRSRRS